MGCNDYNLHLDSSSGDNNATPEFRIYLDGVGVNGYSPTVDVTNETTDSFRLQINDVNGSELSPAIPKSDYLQNQLNDIPNQYLKVDGSNADNPITINGHALQSLYGGLNTKLTMTGSPAYIEAPNLILNATSYNGTIYYAKRGIFTPLSELATIGDIQDIDITNKLDIGGSNADSNFTINGVELTNNSIYIANAPYSYINATQENPEIYYELGIDRARAFLSMPSFTINSYPYPNQSTLISTTSDFCINTQGAKFYYGSSTVDDNEVATKSDIPSIMIGTDGNTNGTTGLVPAPLTTDAGKYLRADGTWGTPSGSGGGGTSDYSELTNKPQINSVTLDGNKTSSDLGLQEQLVSGTNIKTINNQPILGSGNIDIQGGGAVDSVNGQTGAVVLNASDVGALPDTTTIPTKTSDLTNDSNFATVSQIPTNNNQLTNGAGYITSVTSSDVTTALGYTPYDNSNPNGYTSNIGTVTSVNNTQPDSQGNITIDIPNTNDFVTNSSLATTLTDYVTLANQQTISGKKQFSGGLISTLPLYKNDTTTQYGALTYSGTTDFRIRSYNNMSINLIPHGTGEVQYNGTKIATVNDISNLADTDLSNINSSCKALDGQFIPANIAISTATAVGTYDIDMNSLLPEDNYDYMLYIQFFGNSSQGTAWCDITSSVLTRGIRIATLGTSYYGGTTFQIPISTDRKLTYSISNNDLNTHNLIMYGYRRIGTNS